MTLTFYPVEEDYIFLIHGKKLTMYFSSISPNKYKLFIPPKYS